MAKRYQTGNQKSSIEKGQTAQWPKDTKTGNQKSSIEEGQTAQWPKDTKQVIRSRKSKDRQYNGQK